MGRELDGGTNWLRMKNNSPWKALVRDIQINPVTNDLILAIYLIVCSYSRQKENHISRDWLINAILLELGAMGSAFQILKISTIPCFFVGYAVQGDPRVI